MTVSDINFCVLKYYVANALVDKCSSHYRNGDYLRGYAPPTPHGIHGDLFYNWFKLQKEIFASAPVFLKDQYLFNEKIVNIYDTLYVTINRFTTDPQDVQLLLEIAFMLKPELGNTLIFKEISRELY